MKNFEEASFETVPQELKLKIFNYLPAKDLEKVSFISRGFFSLARNASLCFLENIEPKCMKQLNFALQRYTKKGELSIDLFSKEEVEKKLDSSVYFSDKDAENVLLSFYRELKKIIPNISCTYYRDEADKRVNCIPYPIRYRISIPEDQAIKLLDKVGNYNESTGQCFLKR